MELLEEEKVDAKMKDKDGNDVEMNGSLDNLFDGSADTFLELENGNALALLLEMQIKLLGRVFNAQLSGRKRCFHWPEKSLVEKLV